MGKRFVEGGGTEYKMFAHSLYYVIFAVVPTFSQDKTKDVQKLHATQISWMKAPERVCGFYFAAKKKSEKRDERNISKHNISAGFIECLQK